MFFSSPLTHGAQARTQLTISLSFIILAVSTVAYITQIDVDLGFLLCKNHFKSVSSHFSVKFILMSIITEVCICHRKSLVHDVAVIKWRLCSLPWVQHCVCFRWKYEHHGNAESLECSRPGRQLSAAAWGRRSGNPKTSLSQEESGPKDWLQRCFSQQVQHICSTAFPLWDIICAIYN